jgi:hypothetical protein
LDWRIALLAAGFASLIWAFILKLINIGGFVRLMKNG